MKATYISSWLRACMCLPSPWRKLHCKRCALVLRLKNQRKRAVGLLRREDRAILQADFCASQNSSRVSLYEGGGRAAGLFQSVRKCSPEKNTAPQKRKKS